MQVQIDSEFEGEEKEEVSGCFESNLLRQLLYLIVHPLVTSFLFGNEMIINQDEIKA